MLMSCPLLPGYTKPSRLLTTGESDAINDPSRPIPSGRSPWKAGAVQIWVLRSGAAVAGGTSISGRATAPRCLCYFALGGSLVSYIYLGATAEAQAVTGWLPTMLLAQLHRFALGPGRPCFGRLTWTQPCHPGPTALAGLGIAVSTDSRAVEG